MSKTIAVSSKEQLDSILQSSQFVTVNFASGSSSVSQQISALYETLSTSLSRPNVVTFATVDSDSNADLTSQYDITVSPTLVVFRQGKVTDKVQGANPGELKAVVEKLAFQVFSVKDGEAGPSGSGSGSGSGEWNGAEIPRGYSDITSEVEVRGCELLNADEDAGPVKVLFQSSKPSSLGSGKGSSKDWVQSSSDDQLLLFIPMQSTVKLHTLQITSLAANDQTDVSKPVTLHLFLNKPQNMDFDEADESDPTQVITLNTGDWNETGTASIPLRFVKFQKTNTLIIYVQQGDGDGEVVRIDRVKLIGEAGTKREMGKLQKLGDED